VRRLHRCRKTKKGGKKDAKDLNGGMHASELDAETSVKNFHVRAPEPKGGVARKVAWTWGSDLVAIRNSKLELNPSKH
jgi:hypothetical protein